MFFQPSAGCVCGWLFPWLLNTTAPLDLNISTNVLEFDKLPFSLANEYGLPIILPFEAIPSLIMMSLASMTNSVSFSSICICLCFLNRAFYYYTNYLLNISLCWYFVDKVMHMWITCVYVDNLCIIHCVAKRSKSEWNERVCLWTSRNRHLFFLFTP